MAASPLPSPARIVSSNVLPIAQTGVNEPAVENSKEVFEPLIGFEGNMIRHFLGNVPFPATNDGP